MNFCGIVCEFNPFHNGHEYIINQAKQITGCEIICLMSGDFVQRGTPAIESKYERAKKAIYAGANAVLELPCVYATTNAENFAYGAIKTFKALGVTKIAFGVESTDIETLTKVAKLKYENSERFKQAFKNEIENGINYNTALKRSIALALDDENILKVLNEPNNILAIEYLTAILKLNTNIEPIAINRCDNGFNSKTHKEQFLSASGIRELMMSGNNYENYIPSYAKITKPFTKSEQNVFNTLCTLTIRQSLASELEKFYDYNEGIEYRIKEMADKFSNLEDIIEMISTPRYRISRVSKLCLYPLLGITKNIQQTAKQCKPFAKVLAVNKNNKSLLNAYSKNKINLIVTNTDYNNLSASQKKIASIDINASNTYNTIIKIQNNNDKKTGTLFL